MTASNRYLDYINLKIINILTTNASISFVELSKKLGISDATVHLRIKKLLNSGVIKKFTICIDNNLIGYDHLAFVTIKIENGHTEEVKKELLKIEEILEIHEIYDKFDLLLKIRTRDLEDMRNVIVNKILKILYVKESEFMTVLKTIKEDQSVSLESRIKESEKEFF
ncbi:MAG: Lrp/AsnC family transcriptional regulator [Nitrososphaeraceae archaeon]